MWEESERYPDPRVVSLHPDFDLLRLSLASVERIATGCRWAEGPVWFGDGRYLLWSDIPNDRIMRWEAETGAVSVFRRPSRHANGNTRDRQGRLVTCEHDARRVTRTEYDGTITVLASHHQGRSLNSPNDVVVAADGGIWFSDPKFGIASEYEGHKAASELPEAVWRLDPESGQLEVVAGGFPGPNGLAFSPDGRTLYIVQSRGARAVRAYDVTADGRHLANERVLIEAGDGTPDGLRVDTEGHLWCGWGMGQAGSDGVRVFAPDSRPIGRIDLPERCANLCFGGPKRNRLFMAASHSVYALYVNAQGVAGG